MAQKRNFLLGKGERLAEDIRVGSPPVNKVSPYTFEQAKKRLEPMLKLTVSEIEELPADACPDDLAVATITMNPEYIAKTYFPADLLRAVGLEPIGSRSKIITPEKKSGDRTPEEAFTTDLFVMGKRLSFKRWANSFNTLSEMDPGASQIKSIEEISFQTPEEKIKIDDADQSKQVFEIVLHLDEENGENRYLNQFKKYLKKHNLSPDFEHRFYAGGLCLLENEAPKI
jgi:hypothetical protein